MSDTGKVTLELSDILPTMIGAVVAAFGWLLKGKFDVLSSDIKDLGESVHELSRSVSDLKDDMHARSLESKDWKLECMSEIGNLKMEIQKKDRPTRPTEMVAL